MNKNGYKLLCFKFNLTLFPIDVAPVMYSMGLIIITLLLKQHTGENPHLQQDSVLGQSISYLTLRNLVPALRNIPAV